MQSKRSWRTLPLHSPAVAAHGTPPACAQRAGSQQNKELALRMWQRFPYGLQPECALHAHKLLFFLNGLNLVWMRSAPHTGFMHCCQARSTSQWLTQRRDLPTCRPTSAALAQQRSCSTQARLRRCYPCKPQRRPMPCPMKALQAVSARSKNQREMQRRRPTRQGRPPARGGLQLQRCSQGLCCRPGHGQPQKVKKRRLAVGQLVQCLAVQAAMVAKQCLYGRGQALRRCIARLCCSR